MQTESRMPLVRLLKIDQTRYRIRYNTFETTDEEGNVIYKGEEITITDPGSRSDIIEAVIREKYSQSQMEAIINNYLSSDDVEDDFTVMQKYRKMAKLVADGLVSKEDIDKELDAIVSIDRIEEIEETTTSIVEVLNDKNIIP